MYLLQGQHDEVLLQLSIICVTSIILYKYHITSRNTIQNGSRLRPYEIFKRNFSLENRLLRETFVNRKFFTCPGTKYLKLIVEEAS